MAKHIRLGTNARRGAEAEHTHVGDRADSLVIEDGWIVAQAIHYTVQAEKWACGRSLMAITSAARLVQLWTPELPDCGESRLANTWDNIMAMSSPPAPKTKISCVSRM